MNKLSVMCVSALLIAALQTTGAQQGAAQLEKQLARAHHKATIDGDLPAAIEEYKQIVTAAGTNRTIAAQALVRMAECYQKLGDAKSKEIYQRIVLEYNDQPQALREARNRLVELGVGEKAADTHVVARQIWIGDDVNVEGSPSADGKILTFIDWNSTNTGNVAIRDLTTGLNKRLTNATIVDGYASDPTMSPDGKQVGYVFYGEGTTTLRTIGVDGGQPRVIARFPRQAVYQPRWSPDGRRLAAVVRDGGDGTWRIVLIDVAGGSVTTLKSTEWRSAMLGGFSPDGRYLLYGFSKIESSADTGIYAIAVDGSRESALVQGTTDDRSPVWTPDGRGVAFLSDRSGTLDLWLVAVADGKPEGEPAIIRTGVGNIVNMGFTRDGSYFYGTRNATQDVYVAAMNPDTLDVVTKPRRLSDQLVGSNLGPSWSPDGRSIAFVRGRDRLKRSVVIRAVADGSERTLPVKLVDGFAVGAFGAKWLPDSRALLVPEADYTKRIVTLHNVDLETGVVQTVLQDDLRKVYPKFVVSPDGRSIYFTRREPGSAEQMLLRLIRRDVTSGAETELYRAESLGVGFFALAISPSGDRLSFSVNVGDKGERHLMVVPTAGGPARSVFRGDYYRPTPNPGVWTKDGKYVLAVAEEKGTLRRVWAFPVDGGEPRKLDIVFEGIADAELSQDGKQLAFTGSQTDGEVWMVKNLLTRPRP